MNNKDEKTWVEKHIHLIMKEIDNSWKTFKDDEEKIEFLVKMNTTWNSFLNKQLYS